MKERKEPRKGMENLKERKEPSKGIEYLKERTEPRKGMEYLKERKEEREGMEYLKREYVKGARQNKKESGTYLKETRKKVGKGLIEKDMSVS